MVIRRIRSFCNWLVAQERSPDKLAFSICLGIYIAFSPFVGFHTILKILASRIFKLNFAVLFTISVLINNPWTMIPVYSMGHFCGAWLFRLFSIDALQWDPAWLGSCNTILQGCVGISGISLAAFFVGCNVLGLLISLALYPVVKHIFVSYMEKKQTIA